METTLSDLAFSAGRARAYRLDGPGPVESYVATSPGTRAICNDPAVAGVAYTNALRDSCADILRALGPVCGQSEAVVVNLLRGGLNFGLREALAAAYGWNSHTTCFMSAQRARDEADPEAWHITENAYKKVYLPERASFFVGDVVATGTSLRYALRELVNTASEQKTDVRNIVFFTYGGPAAREILAETDVQCRRLFPAYGRTILVFLEGCFSVASTETPLQVRLTGTDLLRLGSAMAPEFVESQYESPSYPIERCTIYDAGSRAFWLCEYVSDVIGYWRQNLQFANHGMTFGELLAERFPSLDPARFGHVDLRALALDRMERMERLLNPEPNGSNPQQPPLPK